MASRWIESWLSRAAAMGPALATRARDSAHAAGFGLLLATITAGGALAAAPANVPIPADAEKRLAAILDGTATAFVLQDPETGRFVRYDGERCRRQMTPFSTFKIPNTLIALDTGVIRDPDTSFPWDPGKHPRREFWPEPWARDQTLRTAFRNSVVWFYQDLAVAVGPEKMQRNLDRFHYGNRDISGGQDRFWLGSTLAISADEQVEFLRAFHEGRLGLKPETTRTAKEVFQYEKGDGYVLSAKTGGGETTPGQALGWFVGYLETAGKVYYFALNTDGASFEAIRDKRIDLTRRALRALGLLPPEPGPASRASRGASRAPGDGTGEKR